MILYGDINKPHPRKEARAMPETGATKLSVAMATCNGALYVREQLESIRLQSRLPDELVVSDDCSEDRTTEIIDDYRSQCVFPITILHNERRLGVSKNFERAIGHCTGDIIALADQDDFWEPEKLAIQVSELERNPGLDAVFSDAAVVDEQLRPTGKTLLQTRCMNDQHRLLLAEGDAFRIFISRNLAAGMTLAFRARLRSHLLPIPDFWVGLHDWWIALMVSAIGQISLIDQPLVNYRQHGANQIGAGDIDVGDDPQQELSKKEKWNYKIERDRDRVRRHELMCQFLSGLDLPERAARSLAQESAHISHLKKRVKIRQINSRWHRAPLALMELLNFGYWRFSKSTAIKMFAKDIRGPKDI